MIGVTASSLSRRMNCPGSATLPKAENYSQWAEMGHDEHAELADFAKLPPEIAKHIPPDAQSEVKLVYNVATREGRIIGSGADRQYGEIGPMDIPGSTDVLGSVGFVGDDDAAVVIADFKTGFHAVEPAATNPQLHLYAVAAADAVGVDRAIVRIIYTKTSRVDEHTLEADDLRDFRNRLEALFTAPPNSTTREGTWCRYCPSRHACPSKNGALVQIATGGLAVLGDALMTPDRAAEAVRQVLRVEAMVKDAKARLLAYINETGPVDLGDGTGYGVHVREGDERISNVDTLVEAIRGALPDKEQASAFESVAVERKTSKAAIERAAKSIGHKPRFAKAIVDRVRELGGITHGPEKRPVGVFALAKLEQAPLEIPFEDINRLLETA